MTAYTSPSRVELAAIERDEGDDVLDLEEVDLGDLAEALEDHSYDRFVDAVEPWISEPSRTNAGDDPPV